MGNQYRWSDAQRAAIETEGCNILVSAGAGSGKTAVLSERVYQLLKKNKDISKFLVLTFTEAASMEMKNRIRNKLLEDQELSYMVPEVEAAHIETFDAFALFIVKKYALQLGLSPNITNLDQSILTLEQYKYINDILTRLFEEKNPVLLDMMAKFCTKDDTPIKQLVLNLLRVASLRVDKSSYLRNFVTNYFDEKRIKDLIDIEKTYLLSLAKAIYSSAGQLMNTDDATEIQNFIEPLLDCKSYDELREKLLKMEKFPRKPTGQSLDDALRNAIKDLFEKKVSYKENDYGPSEDIIKTYLGNKEYAEFIQSIAIEVDERCEAFMKEHNAFDFSSIALLASQLLHIEEIRKEISESFDYILVDEYQDTSDIQETVLSKIGRDNIYMVGDVKQSIYKFRNANCSIFLEKFNSYKEHKGGLEIDLNTSYRSRREIVDAVNDIFSKLMKKEFNPIDYSNGHHFGFGLTDYDSLIDPKGGYGLSIYPYDKPEDMSQHEKEAEIIALDIINKIEKGYLVYDAEKKALRKCTFKDFAILISSSTHFDTYRKVFAKRNIPLFVMHEEKILDSDISYVTKNLLVLFNAIRKDELDTNEFSQAYASIARSFLVRMNDQDLYTVIKSKLYYHTDIYKKVYEVVELYKDSSNYEALNALYKKFDLNNKIITIGNYTSNSHKSKVFLDLIASMDKLGFSTAQIIEYFNNLPDYKLEISYSSKESGENSVTLTTIHKSKGLEYPTVYLPAMDSLFNRSDTKTPFLVHSDYGLILPYVGDNPYANLFLHYMKVNEGVEDYKEKLRLFYVAFTRARERLIIPLARDKKESETIIPGFSSSFKAMLKNVYDLAKYNVDYQFDISKLSLKEQDEIKYDIDFKKVKVDSKVIERKRASKQIEGDVNESLLEFGNMVHYLLEVVDYETKDTSFIKSANLRKIIDRVLSNPLFEGVTNSMMRHEYRFYDEKNDIQGAIDCLILREESIDIVDFKLKNIDDINYIKQLHTYRDYIKSITDKEVRMYLISSLTGEVKQIDE